MVRQSGLGRGLQALIPTSPNPGSSVGAAGPSPLSETDASTPNAILVELSVSSIRPNAFQPRQAFSDDDLTSLSASIAEIGVLQPVLVRPAGDGQYELIAGERRWRASQRAGLSTIPAIIRTTEDTAALEQALVENLHRVDLNAVEEAAAYQQLIEDFHFTHDQVALRVGRSRAAVTNTLRLLQLSPSIQRLIMEGQISAGHARALLGTADKSYQESQARRIVAEGLSVRAVEDAVRLREGKRSPSAPVPSKTASSPASPPASQEVRPASLLELEGMLAELLDTKVSVELPDGRKGRMVIQFADLADLERVSKIIASAAQNARQAE
jgi:ParB family transcriptional regulator, chromosome partitioning protein